MGSRRLCVRSLLLLTNLSLSLAGATNNFYAIAHMTNTPIAVDYALESGANGIELDIQIDTATGELVEFRHGGMCDCACSFYTEMCPVLSKDADAQGVKVCEVATPWLVQMRHIATKSDLQLLYIDSKLTKDHSLNVQVAAGRNLVSAVAENILDNRTFQGDILISAGDDSFLFYIQSAIETAQKLPPHISHRIYFTIDATRVLGLRSFRGIDQNINIVKVALQLASLSMNTVYSNGLTACMTYFDYQQAIRQGVRAMSEGYVTNVFVWTADRQEKYREVYTMGARGIVTNDPLELVTWARNHKINFARAGDGTLKRSKEENDLASNKKGEGCECKYIQPVKAGSGGCIVTRLPPKGRACKCKYIGFWACTGSLVYCKDPQHPLCEDPEPGYEMCVLGGGDCEGYPTCDCNYVRKGLDPSGCVLSMTPKNGTACKCKYRGAWTCGGVRVACDLAEMRCRNPVMSKETCVLGGGDCGGY
eukprot:comp20735_c1_seq1/m.27128 comp20735_c1_seq1/g.27128  ORF comp20735_c1_seq1/g.27128 comp20735_c1_seq1/m.27128 type:complete len:478 (-) comp20735_c1_seq1:21-1454(-)